MNDLFGQFLGFFTPMTSAKGLEVPIARRVLPKYAFVTLWQPCALIVVYQTHPDKY